jgi:hypothetical protein
MAQGDGQTRSDSAPSLNRSPRRATLGVWAACEVPTGPIGELCKRRARSKMVGGMGTYYACGLHDRGPPPWRAERIR